MHLFFAEQMHDESSASISLAQLSKVCIYIYIYCCKILKNKCFLPVFKPYLQSVDG